MAQWVSDFNPRTHVGCDQAELSHLVWLIDFNPRTHVGCDSVQSVSWKSRNTVFQSTHPRGVRRCDGLPDSRNHKISIHAPTWGATETGELGLTSRFISIHAPTWGATVETTSNLSGYPISIHAPTWGATPYGRRLFLCHTDFNPRTHVGCDY